MDLRWNYQYYQPWSDNEWLIQELMNDNDVIERDNRMELMIKVINNFHCEHKDSWT